MDCNHAPGFRAPVMVTVTLRLPALFLCSQSHIPCHVPKFSLPSDTGIVSEEPKKQALSQTIETINWFIENVFSQKGLTFMCAGISSGPSHECRNGVLCKTIEWLETLESVHICGYTSGISRDKNISISSRTSGSQFLRHKQIRHQFNWEDQ